MKNGLLKKITVASLVAAMALGMVACGSTSSATDTAATDTATTDAAEDTSAPAETTTAASGDSYDIIVNLTWAAEAPETATMKADLEAITEATDGRLTFTVYDSGTLVAIMDTYKGVQDGLCDITFMPNNVAYDYLPLNGRLLTMPMMGYTSVENANAVYNQIREEYPEVDSELEDVGLVNLGAFFNGGTDIYLAKEKDIASVDDLKGMKIGNSDALVNEIINNIGATGVSVSSADAYTGLDNGVVDAMVQHPLFFRVTGCADIIKEVVEIGDTGITRQDSMLVMNKAKYDTLPEDLQQALEDGFDTITADLAQLQVDGVASYKQTLQDNGAKYITLTGDQIKPIEDAAAVIQASTIEELEGQGVKAQEIFDRVQELIKEN